MSFVKDDSAYTRGVGAVASMDAASPNRRRAAARAAVEMARRDGIMSRHTLGRISQTDTSDGGGGSGGGGGGGTTGGGGRGPVRPGRPGLGGRRPLPPKKPLPPKPVPPRFPIRDLSAIRNGKLQVKLPGAVLEPVKGGAADTKTGTPITQTAQPAAPTKPQVNVVAGGASTWVSGSGGGGKVAPEAPPDMPPDEPELPPDAPIQTAPAKPKSNLLMYAAIGIGAYWLLTRKH